jgi:hypothetical protein
VFFVGLVVLDPVVVALAGFVRRGGIWLAAGVMALDVTANWIGNWPSLHADPARLLGPVGLVPITLFGVFVLVTAQPMLHVMKADISRVCDPGHQLGAASRAQRGEPRASLRSNVVNPGVHSLRVAGLGLLCTTSCLAPHRHHFGGRAVGRVAGSDT